MAHVVIDQRRDGRNVDGPTTSGRPALDIACRAKTGNAESTPVIIFIIAPNSKYFSRKRRLVKGQEQLFRQCKLTLSDRNIARSQVVPGCILQDTRHILQDL
ncbi:hypothetical protein J6590_054564 [Homalodisca vitripennis]|nr:hypothetical protein J6590_054564 [Homalodisca vitripennis]